MKKTPSIIDTYYKSLGTKIFRDTTALPFADGGPLNDRNIHGDLLPSVYASALGRYYGNGGKFLTAGGEYHRIYKNPEGDIMVNHPQEDKGKWDTINLTEKADANTITEGVEATKQWHADNPNVYGSGGQLKPDYSLPEDSFQQGGRGLKNSVYASSMGQYPAPYAEGGPLNGDPGPKPKFKPQPKPLVITDPKEYAYRKAAYDDSLWLYQNNLRIPALMQPYKSKYKKNDSWLEKLAKWSVDEKVINRKNLTLTPQQFNQGLKTTWYQSGIGRLINPVGDGKSQDLNHLYTTNEADKHTYSPAYDAYYDIGKSKNEKTGYYLTGHRDLPNNEPISYVGNSMRSKNNTGESGQFISQFEPRYKKPVQPVLFKEEIKPIKKTYPPVVKKPVTYINPPVEEIIPTEQPQPPIQDNYPPPPSAEGFPPGPPPPPPFNGVEPFIQGDPIPEYATPDPGAEFVPDTERYIDWNGNSIGFNGVRFRKPGHGGDLIKKGSRHYLHYPSIETRHSADIVPEDTEEFAQGGMMNQYPDGGPIYTYAKRPGSYYQKDDSGQWYISNKGTGGQYVPVDDPSGQRAAALNKGAVVTMANPTADKYSNVAPSYDKSPMVQSVAGRTEAERQPVENDIYSQNFMSQMRQDTAESQKNALPQHEQPLVAQDWLWTLPMMGGSAIKSAGTALADGIGALGTKAAPYITGALETSIPGMASVPGATVGNAVAAGFAADAAVNRLPKIPGQISRGEYTDAAANALTGVLDVAGAGVMSPLYQGAKSTASEFGKLLNTEDGLLSNTYKVNPFAFKPNPNAYYRGIGKAGMDDALNTGVLRSNKTGTGLTNNTTYDAVFFDKGKTRLADALGNGNIAEVRDVPMKEFSPNHMGVAAFDENTGKFLNEIPLGDNTRLLKKDWLKGYKEVNKEIIPEYTSNNISQNSAAAEALVGKPFMSLNIPKEASQNLADKSFSKLLSNPSFVDQLKEWNLGVNSDINSNVDLNTASAIDLPNLSKEQILKLSEQPILFSDDLAKQYENYESVVKDENGMFTKVGGFHGHNTPFDQFDRSYRGLGFGNQTSGVYLGNKFNPIYGLNSAKGGYGFNPDKPGNVTFTPFVSEVTAKSPENFYSTDEPLTLNARKQIGTINGIDYTNQDNMSLDAIKRNIAEGLAKKDSYDLSKDLDDKLTGYQTTASDLLRSKGIHGEITNDGEIVAYDEGDVIKGNQQLYYDNPNQAMFGLFMQAIAKPQAAQTASDKKLINAMKHYYGEKPGDKEAFKDFRNGGILPKLYRN